MPLHIPTVGESLTATLVWAATARTLTDAANYMADVSGLQTDSDAVTRLATIIAATAGLTTHFDLTEFEKSQAPTTENAAVSWAVTTADRSLGSKDITVDIPEGATIISVLAVARINIMNNSATAQKIDLKLEVAVDGGAATALFNQTDVIGFAAVDGASGSYIIAEDASDEVTADGEVATLEAKVTLSAATSVRFQAQYYLFTTYKMG